jgi:hypothetical protein
MAKWMIGLGVAAGLTAAKMMAHPALPQQTPESRADITATGLNAMAPMALGVHSTLTGAKADGRTIELDIRLNSSMALNVPQDAFARAMTAMTCKNGDVADLLSKGGAVRYAITTVDGVPLTPVTVSSCSA